MPADAGQDPLILFDGVCNLCNKTVRFVIRHDPKRRFRFAPLQSALARRLLAEHPEAAGLDSMALVKDGRVHLHSGAALRVAALLRWPWPALAILLVVPWPLRDLVYRFVAKHRYRWFGRTGVCSAPAPETSDRFVAEPDEPVG